LTADSIHGAATATIIISDVIVGDVAARTNGERSEETRGHTVETSSHKNHDRELSRRQSASVERISVSNVKKNITGSTATTKKMF
jgi:hypothetical protein